MTKVAILPELSDGGELAYRAIAGGCQSLAKTVGAALDALIPQLPADDSGLVVIIQSQLPDRFFTAAQKARLEHLMARWRTARDAGGSLPPSEQAELEALADAEVRGSAERAAALSSELDR